MKYDWWIFGGIVIGVVFGISLFQTVFSTEKVRPKSLLSASEYKTCLDHLRKLDAALGQYAADHNGYLPPENGAAGLEYLRKSGLVTDDALFICPGSGLPPLKSGPLTEDHCSYAFYGRTRLPGKAEELLLLDKPGNHPGEAYHAVHADRTIESRE